MHGVFVFPELGKVAFDVVIGKVPEGGNGSVALFAGVPPHDGHGVRSAIKQLPGFKRLGSGFGKGDLPTGGISKSHFLPATGPPVEEHPLSLSMIPWIT